jgi:hypothetical protein
MRTAAQSAQIPHPESTGEDERGLTAADVAPSGRTPHFARTTHGGTRAREGCSSPAESVRQKHRSDKQISALDHRAQKWAAAQSSQNRSFSTLHISAIYYFFLFPLLWRVKQEKFAPRRRQGAIRRAIKILCQRWEYAERGGVESIVRVSVLTWHTYKPTPGRRAQSEALGPVQRVAFRSRDGEERAK